MNVIKIFKRFVYNNYLRPSRLPYYDKLIAQFKEADYVSYTLKSLNDCKLEQEEMSQLNGKKILVLRHDIDTDPRTAWLMARIEKKHGYIGSYYFRLSTANSKYMKLIAEMGHEVSYHYEEIASYSKKYKFRNRQQVEKHIEPIRMMFADNLKNFRNVHGLDCKTIASHGEWINVYYLNMTNLELLNNELRKELGIEVEAYDADFMKPFLNARINDLGGQLWDPYPVEDAINNNEPYIYILLHPRQWYTRGWCNFFSDIKRLLETIKYKYL